MLLRRCVCVCVCLAAHTSDKQQSKNWLLTPRGLKLQQVVDNKLLNVVFSSALTNIPFLARYRTVAFAALRTLYNNIYSTGISRSYYVCIYMYAAAGYVYL